MNVSDKVVWRGGGGRNGATADLISCGAPSDVSIVSARRPDLNFGSVLSLRWSAAHSVPGKNVSHSLEEASQDAAAYRETSAAKGS